MTLGFLARGRKALGVLREQVEQSGADTMLVIHDDHFVNFDFRADLMDAVQPRAIVPENFFLRLLADRRRKKLIERVRPAAVDVWVVR